ncbi:MAG: hypothetical protein ACOH5I_09880 [Oligoflexus sp.]
MSISASSPINSTRSLIYPYGYFAFLDAADKVINSKQEVRSIGEQSIPLFPSFPIKHPGLQEHYSERQHFVSQLMSHMDQYWDHFQDSALEKEIFFRLFQRDRNLRIEQMISFQRMDILEAYILSLLFERQFLNALARHQMFYDQQIKNKFEADVCRGLHCEQKALAALEASRWFQEQFSHPYRFAIRRPNQIKMIDLLRYTTLQNQSLMWDSIALSRQQSRSLSQFFGKEWSTALMELQDALRRQQPGHVLSRLRWISEIFIHSWEHAWEFNAAFQDLVREQLMLRAVYFPEFYAQDKQVHPRLLEQAVTNETASIQQSLTDRSYWQQIVAAQTNRERTAVIPPATSYEANRPFHWQDRVYRDPSMQPLLVEQLQREWHIEQNTGIHQAAIKNAQFETALANPYGFDSKRLHSRESLMEEALQEQKIAESLASQQLQQQQTGTGLRHDVHIEICKILAGIDYAANQNLRCRSEQAHEAATRTEQGEISRIDRVKKVVSA